MSGHRVIPNAAGHFYSATKFAVSGILEGIRNELQELNSHIRVTVRYYTFEIYTFGLRLSTSAYTEKYDILFSL